MNLTLTRFCYSQMGTFGALEDETKGFKCFTVEEVWTFNKPHVSCIPEGQYVCKRGQFPRFGDTFEVTNVPGRSAILIHPANTIFDIEGCIGPGERLGCIDGNWAVVESMQAYRRLMSLLSETSEFLMTINHHTGARM